MGASPCCRPGILNGAARKGPSARRINRVSALSTVDGRVIAYHGGDG